MNFTDHSLPAIRRYIEQRLAKADLVTLTRGQVEALLRAADPPVPDDAQAPTP